jgi:glycosyltransferase involved in cell wall biosynthesis
VATGVCGNPEVVEDGVNGFLVRPKDSEQLAGVLAKLLADKSLREKLSAAARRDAGRFSRTATFSEVERVLERAAGC